MYLHCNYFFPSCQHSRRAFQAEKVHGPGFSPSKGRPGRTIRLMGTSARLLAGGAGREGVLSEPRGPEYTPRGGFFCDCGPGYRR